MTKKYASAVFAAVILMISTAWRQTDPGLRPGAINGQAAAAPTSPLPLASVAANSPAGVIVEKVDPFLSDRKYNPIPVRVIIDPLGRVKHIHFLSAFPDQARIITDALLQWKFKPYLRDGRPVEVETGILFGQTPPNLKSPPAIKTASTIKG
jgi:hypothetical protein